VLMPLLPLPLILLLLVMPPPLSFRCPAFLY
jgi:hypothetical protein